MELVWIGENMLEQCEWGRTFYNSVNEGYPTYSLLGLDLLAGQHLVDMLLALVEMIDQMSLLFIDWATSGGSIIKEQALNDVSVLWHLTCAKCQDALSSHWLCQQHNTMSDSNSPLFMTCCRSDCHHPRVTLAASEAQAGEELSPGSMVSAAASGSASSPQSEAVTSELKELSLQSMPSLLPLSERKNGELIMC